MTTASLKRALTWCVLAGLAAGCASGSDGPTSPRDTSAEARSAAAVPDAEMRDGLYFVLPGAPDPLSCESDDECLGDTVVRADGCCVLNPMPRPQTRAWHQWISTRRMSEACGSVECPPPPMPSPPPDCSFEVTCAEGRCRDACP